MTKSDKFALVFWILAMGVWGFYTQDRIDGLTTRVNLLESRIHWQEEPPK